MSVSEFSMEMSRFSHYKQTLKKNVDYYIVYFHLIKVMNEAGCLLSASFASTKKKRVSDFEGNETLLTIIFF